MVQGARGMPVGEGGGWVWGGMVLPWLWGSVVVVVGKGALCNTWEQPSIYGKLPYMDNYISVNFFEGC